VLIDNEAENGDNNIYLPVQCWIVCTNSQFQSQDGRNNLLYLPTDFLLIIYTHSPSSLIFSRAHERQYYVEKTIGWFVGLFISNNFTDEFIKSESMYR